MAFAPYTNDRRTIGIDSKVLGQFREKEHDNLFEYSENNTGMFEAYPHLVWVNDGYRYATVKKTVAYIAIDEIEDGEFLVEKWSIKNFREYE